VIHDVNEEFISGGTRPRLRSTQDMVQEVEDEKWLAFRAGFDASEEGWNGEHVGHPDRLEAALRMKFLKHIGKVEN
jgi:hypothetical protein